ncbi:hypothetical protein BSKO_03808 [Bryopsis sp. KO-2023]|nr:hypothetical protein BSKO_03808 [Bryopsis sp. KO-2023]
MAQNPAAALNNLYMGFKGGGRPSYEVVTVPDADESVSRKCMLTCPGIEGSGFDGQVFLGFSRNKKLAQQDAAGKAMEYFTAHPLLSQKQASASLIERMVAVFSEKGMAHDPMFQGYLFLAVKHNDGIVPLGLLPNSRDMRKAMKSRGITSAAQEAVESLECMLGSDGLRDDQPTDDVWLRKGGVEYALPIRFYDDMEDRYLRGVKKNFDGDGTEGVIVFDDGREPSVGWIPVGTSILSSIASILGVEPNRLILCLKNVTAPRLLHPSLDPCSNQEESDSNVESEGKPSGPDFEVEVRQPSVWVCRRQKSDKYNTLASWLCGEEIYGKAFFTLCRPSATSKADPKISMNWRPYTVNNFWLGVCSRFPTSHSLQDKNGIISRLPNSFRNFSSWDGQTPCEVLSKYCAFLKLPQPEYSMAESDGRQTCLCSTNTFLRDEKCSAEATDKNQDYAKQQAALAVLHQIKSLDATILLNGAVAETKKDSLPIDVNILDRGVSFGLIAGKGTAVKVSYTIHGVRPDGGRILVERCEAFVFDVDGGGALQPLNEAVKELRAKAKFTVRFESCLEGEDILGKFDSFPMELQGEVLSISGIVNNTAGMFCPALGVQRYESAAQALSQHHATNILDLGCGAGRFLQVLLRENPNLSSLAGIDISQSALRGAIPRIRNAFHLRMGKLGKTSPDVDVDLYYGNALCEAMWSRLEWSLFEHVDAVSMVEVVEHLDPIPLKQVGGVILGGLNPPVFVVSTPNWEYNQIIRYLGGCTAGPPGRDGFPLRCNDHRFEWTRKEFEGWAAGLADQFDYYVSFGGCGKAVDEGSVLEELSLEDVGYATQMAVFTRKGPRSTPVSQRAAPTILSNIWSSKDFDMAPLEQLSSDDFTEEEAGHL